MIRVEDLSDALPTWLVAQRWFRAKARGASDVRTWHAAELTESLVHAMVDVDGEPYQLLLGVRADVPAHLDHTVIGRIGARAVYDATQDPQLMGTLLDLIAGGASAGGLDFRPEPGVELERGLRARPIGVEQSNTSVVFGAQYILKIYRQPVPGPNRDVDLHRALHSAGVKHIAEPLAVISGDLSGDLGAGSTVLGFMQEFLPDAVEGWATATASVRDLLAEADLHADEVGGDFAGEAHRLGVAVAEVHDALARTTGTTPVEPEAVVAAVEAMHARLDAVLAEVPELAADEDTLRAAFDRVRHLRAPTVLQQIHGDLHLGQALRSTAGWVLIDFEGEPAAPPAQRRAPRTPLRDVAAMLRSFDYAAFHLLAGSMVDRADRQLVARANEWSDRNRAAFCDGYAEVAGDPRGQEVLLAALELDKAVYEVRYEHHNRPDWLAIPLAAIRRRS